MKIKDLMKQQRNFYRAGKTRPYAYRLRMLKRLEMAIRTHEKEIAKALFDDLHKAPMEAYMTEIGLALSELDFAKKHLKEWMKQRLVPTPLAQFPARSYVLPEPYGVVLIMAPWNYPFLLTIDPLIGAIAAGNCCVLKPSAYAPHTAAVIKRLLGEVFPEKYVAVVEGGRSANQELLDEKFDYIFFTGGKTVGRLVMEKAAVHLTPVTLELGGKSPCIVAADAEVDLAAKRIVFGKFINSGQTCVAPDYVLVQENVYQPFLHSLKKWISIFLGSQPLKCPSYPRMINQKHYRRVMEYCKSGIVFTGGTGDEASLQIAPTVLTDVKWTDPVMEEEIFGPILPVLPFGSGREVISLLKSRERPLALYLFTKDLSLQRKILKNISFGGGCLNDTLVHLSSPYLAFGGVGESGMGSYHGEKSFATFSHEKSVMVRGRLDIPIRYQPYTKGKEWWIRRFLR
ncbi:MAG: aldehyde dehydrogenase [Blautia sp.]